MNSVTHGRSWATLGGTIGVSSARWMWQWSAAPTNDLTIDLDYNDTYHVGVGTQYRLNPEWLLNSGLSYDSAMISAANRSVSVPRSARSISSAWARIG